MNTQPKVWRARSVVRGAFVAALVGTAMLSSASRSDAQICTAALDVDVHYCLNGVPGGTDCAPPPFSTLDLMAGDQVTLTMEVTNDSQFQVGPNVPDGSLQGPTTPGLVPPPAEFVISYACSQSTCLPAELLPAVFTFNGATILPDAGGKATFTNNGNGTGTLKVTDGGIPYVGGAFKFLVQVKLTVANALPKGTVIFARAEGNRTAFLITDNGCLPGLTGTGQGSTAAQFGGPETQCGNTGRITFPAGTKPGMVNIALRAPGQLNQLLPNQLASLTISNANGPCFTVSVPGNAAGWKGLCNYSDPTAQNGITKITCQQRASNGGEIQMRFQAKGDTSACNLAAMTTTAALGGKIFTHTGVWRPTPNGWRFP